MDKNREGERGEKRPASALPPGLDPATAALYGELMMLFIIRCLSCIRIICFE